MDSRAREVLRIGDNLFGKKKPLDSLWQQLALNFYPERANFTDERHIGEEYSDHLYASYPIIARRELGNLLSSNLRPQAINWFSLHVGQIDLDDATAERQYLEFIEKKQRRAMYDQYSGFVRATKECDHDYATFGNGVIMVTLNSSKNGLLYRNYHLRDCAWSENSDGMVDAMHINEKVSARNLKSEFGDRVSKEVVKACKDDPDKEFDIRRTVLPSRVYQYKGKTGKEYPFVSLIVERDQENVLEETGINLFPFVVPRWQTVSGSQYGRSMATEIALPDGRTLQVVTRTILEAGEKFVDPPMVAIADAIRGDIPLQAGGITIAEMEYDERLGEVLRPISQQSGNMPIGFEIAETLKEDIRHAFFLHQIQLPEPNKEYTAYEFRNRIEEHIRSSAPLFEPVEKDYNNPLCELTFQLLMANGAFPEPPDSLAGSDIRFEFRSPLGDMAEQSEAASFIDGVMRFIAPVAQIDPAQVENVNLTKGLRDALRAIGYRAEWFNDIEAVAAKKQQMEQAMQMQAQLAMAQQAGMAVEQGGKAGIAVNEAMAQQ